ncbi:hypothetical protein HD806DRAFT_491742 [Xylariaceae sp. AK1471]|nr:hypothetical protein HD806DRAFT_491742 [Xylariaceae sp. AK1471]
MQFFILDLLLEVFFLLSVFRLSLTMASFVPRTLSAPRAASSALDAVMIKGVPLALTRPYLTNICAPSPPGTISTWANACATRNYGLGCGLGLTTSTRLLSSASSASAKKNDSANAPKNISQPSQSTASNRQAPSPEDFKISFRDLGMNRITKFVVYAVIGVLGTMETIFWCKALWRWWSGGEEKDERTT